MDTADGSACDRGESDRCLTTSTTCSKAQTCGLEGQGFAHVEVIFRVGFQIELVQK
ncbi:hypothetical protein ACFVH4_00640 [Nocardia ignorata]